MKKMEEVANFIREQFNSSEFIPLHEPKFIGKEKDYLSECIDSTFVSYLGKFVTDLEEKVCDYTGSKYSVAMCNGTSALHIALAAIGIKQDDEVITQALTFVATANAINYCGAKPIFLDSNKNHLGLCAIALEKFLNEFTEQENGTCKNKTTGKIIRACIPMHVFGHAVDIDKIVQLCDQHNIKVIEDAAESLGSFYKGKHTGTFGKAGVISFNGNKIVTCGGGGIVITDDKALADRIKFLSTTAKKPHTWEYFHEEVGYNYRMPNLNAAVALAQMESLDTFVRNKRELAENYAEYFKEKNITFLTELNERHSNYWLNALILENRKERDEALNILNESQVMCRPIWTLLNKLPAFKSCQTDGLKNAQWLEDRVVNIPSSVRL